MYPYVVSGICKGSYSLRTSDIYRILIQVGFKPAINELGATCRFGATSHGYFNQYCNGYCARSFSHDGCSGEVKKNFKLKNTYDAPKPKNVLLPRFIIEWCWGLHSEVQLLQSDA
jgi:hypothetical protein